MPRDDMIEVRIVLFVRSEMPTRTSTTTLSSAGTVSPVFISPLNFKRARISIRGLSPYMQARFSEKAKQAMMEKHKEGGTARRGGSRQARNFEADYRAAMYVDAEGRCGIPAVSFRNACISACRLVNFKMTIGKLSIFVYGDTVDAYTGQDLVLINGEPEMNLMHTRNATGVADIRARPLWRKWSANPIVEWDADQFSLEAVVNLLNRAGRQVGIGEGRPDSRSSCGLGFGTFEVVNDGQV